MIDNNTKGTMRLLIYPVQFEKDPKNSMFLNVEVTRNLAEIAGKLIIDF